MENHNLGLSDTTWEELHILFQHLKLNPPNPSDYPADKGGAVKPRNKTTKEVHHHHYYHQPLTGCHQVCSPPTYKRERKKFKLFEEVIQDIQKDYQRKFPEKEEEDAIKWLGLWPRIPRCITSPSKHYGPKYGPPL